MADTFTLTGVATMGGKTKQRFANGDLEKRVKALTRAGFTDIKLFELPNPMSKEEARAWLEQKFGAHNPITKPAVKTDAKAA